MLSENPDFKGKIQHWRAIDNVMNLIYLKIQFLITFVFFNGFVNSVSAEIYRWVDDDGMVHYTDSMPPSRAQRQQDRLNDTGRIIGSIPAPKSVDELEEEERLTKLQEEQKKIKFETEKRDQMLLAMYSSVDDIEYVRDERIATVDSAIEITQLRKTKFIKKLKELDASEQRFKANGSEAPQWLIASRKHYQEQLSNIDEILEIKIKEKLDINQRFEKDINRYKELKNK